MRRVQGDCPEVRIKFNPQVRADSLGQMAGEIPEADSPRAQEAHAGHWEDKVYHPSEPL
jgi:hypothetical protein